MNAEAVVEVDAIPGSFQGSSPELVARVRSGEMAAREELARHLARRALRERLDAAPTTGEG